MESRLVEPKQPAKRKAFAVVKAGSISVPIYRHTNVIPQRDDSGKIIYRSPDAAGEQQALVKYQSDIFTVACYEGSKRVRLKFSDFEKAKKEAGLAAIKIGNGDIEAVKLRGHDRADYIRAMQKLRAWKPDVNLIRAIADYLAAVSRLPDSASLKEVVDFYLKRHPIGLPQKSIREIVDEPVKSKRLAGKSEIYLKETSFNRRYSLTLGNYSAYLAVKNSTTSRPPEKLRLRSGHLNAAGRGGREARRHLFFAVCVLAAAQ
jgi:hypothetical protein